MTHDLRTCRIPLSAVSAYYHRNLTVRPDPARRLARDCDVMVEVGPGEPIGLAIIESAAHVAYLEPCTGVGFLLMPVRAKDISFAAGFPEVERPDEWRSIPGPGLSLQSADLVSILDRLAVSGWTLLEDERGDALVAGETTDGEPAVCLFGVRASYGRIVLEHLQESFTALHAAADLRHPEP